MVYPLYYFQEQQKHYEWFNGKNHLGFEDVHNLNTGSQFYQRVVYVVSFLFSCFVGIRGGQILYIKQ